MDQVRIDQYWQAYLATLPADAPQRAERFMAEPWGDTPEMADELGALIARGIKTAACGTVWEGEAQGAQPLHAGLKTIVLDGRGEPLCIIETTDVSIRPYDQIDAEFAHAEGEGDRSLAYWRQAHWSFFSRTLSRIGRQPALDMPLCCERFHVVFPRAN